MRFETWKLHHRYTTVIQGDLNFTLAEVKILAMAKCKIEVVLHYCSGNKGTYKCLPRIPHGAEFCLLILSHVFHTEISLPVKMKAQNSGIKSELWNFYIGCCFRIRTCSFCISNQLHLKFCKSSNFKFPWSKNRTKYLYALLHSWSQLIFHTDKGFGM